MLESDLLLMGSYLRRLRQQWLIEDVQLKYNNNNINNN